MIRDGRALVSSSSLREEDLCADGRLSGGVVSPETRRARCMTSSSASKVGGALRFLGATVVCEAAPVSARVPFPLAASFDISSIIKRGFSRRISSSVRVLMSMSMLSTMRLISRSRRLLPYASPTLASLLSVPTKMLECGAGNGSSDKLWRQADLSCGSSNLIAASEVVLPGTVRQACVYGKAADWIR